MSLLSALPVSADISGRHSPFEDHAVVVGLVKKLQTFAADVPHPAVLRSRVALADSATFGASTSMINEKRSGCPRLVEAGG